MYTFASEPIPGNLESISYFSPSANGSSSFEVIRNVSTFREQQPSDGAYFREGELFFLTVAEADTYQPMPGDTITDSASRLYKVQSVGGGWFGGCFQLHTRRLGIQDFQQRATYIRVTAASSDTGERHITETPTGEPFVCAIQPQARTATDLFDTMATPQTYKIWIDGTLGQAINAGDMFEDGNGNKYEILEVSDRKRIDELAVFDCIKKL